MAIPVYMQQFKAAGIYRVVFDSSSISSTNTEILRLVVGYSEKGPFNIPTYVSTTGEFTNLYGNVSKKLEKRGIFFHRLALQCLSEGPILCLNLKKFDGETVDGATINTDFNPVYEPIETVKLNVEDIYDTTRFWELSAEKLNGLTTADNSKMDQYINICATNTASTSATYIIRKASGSKVSSYNITVNDWYSDEDEIPEFLEDQKNNLISDYFAEVYVFNGKFDKETVLASSTLKDYFDVTVYDNEQVLTIKPYVTNAFGESVDTLDTMFSDSLTNPLGHYVGCLIPYFTDKNGGYQSLDIIFNSEQDVHNLMMSFNTEELYDGQISIDISGKSHIYNDDSGTYERLVSTGKITPSEKLLTIENLKNGTCTTTLLGNINAPVISNILSMSVDCIDNDEYKPIVEFEADTKKIIGELYVSDYDINNGTITLSEIAGTNTVNFQYRSSNTEDGVKKETLNALYKLGAAYTVSSAKYCDANNVVLNDNGTYSYYGLYETGRGTFFAGGNAFKLTDLSWGKDDNSTDDGSEESTAYSYHYSLYGPDNYISSISRIDLRTKVTDSSDVSDLGSDELNDVDFINTGSTYYRINNSGLKVTMSSVNVTTTSEYKGNAIDDADDTSSTWAVYGSSVTFIPFPEWIADESSSDADGDQLFTLKSYENDALTSILSVGDTFVSDDTDHNGFGNLVYVREIGEATDSHGGYYYVKFSGTPVLSNPYAEHLVRVDKPLNQEVGTLIPQYLKGYTYINDKPSSTGMKSKLEWQKFILSALTDYTGLRTGLLNKSDIEYRYIVDTFESYVDSECKSILSYLAKEKQSAFAILNFPSVKTFVKCPYTSFTNSKGVFNVQYVVNGSNNKKSTGTKFSLPTDADGASFCAFYSPLKFSDGYVDSIVPSAGLVSNLFVQKYSSRQPYYIIAGPNYGAITCNGLTGPDYNYSMDELQYIEPFGVNCMVYRPGFGTFINANQTAKQTPVSALSKVNVRELVIYLQDEIEKVLQAYQWEFNNATTRNAILDKANSICSNIQANGGIQAYKNIMDETNNTSDIIDNEMAVLSTHIEPGMGCGKMVQELTIYRTGQLSASVSE